MVPQRFNLNQWQEVEEEIRREDERQRALELPAEERYKCLHPTSAAFIYQLALASGARNIVEVGTSVGYSTLWLARAARFNGGKVTTFERNEKAAAKAIEHFTRATVAPYVDLRVGDALQLLPEVAEPVDLAFVDAEKSDYVAYAEILWPKIRAGGSLLADNVISHADEVAPYLEFFCGLADATTLIINIGRGIGWTIKEKL